MSVVLNETQYTENCIKNGYMDKKPSKSLYIISKYYHNVGLDDDEIKIKLVNYMNEFYKKNVGKRFNEVEWDNCLNYTVKATKNIAMIDFGYVPITQHELDTIKTVKRKPTQRLLFSYLCFAKFGNMRNENNNNWVSWTLDEVYRSAKIQGTVSYKADMDREMEDLKLVTFSNRIDNTNLQVNFIDMQGNSVLNVSDFDDLGYVWMNYAGQGRYEKCVDCGKLYRKNKYNTKSTRCLDCQRKIDNEKKKKWWNNQK